MTEPGSAEDRRIQHEKEQARDRAQFEEKLAQQQRAHAEKLASDRAELDEKIAVRTRWLGFVGAIAAAFITAGATLLVESGSKANQDNRTNFLGDVYSGIGVIYRLANPNVPLAQVFPQKPKSIKDIATPASAALPSPAPSAKPAAQLLPIQTSSCAGLDEKLWAISFSPAVPFITGQIKGYIVHLRLRNISKEAIGLKLGRQAEMTDNANNKFGLQSSSIAASNFGIGPTTFSAGVDSPVNLVFGGPASQIGNSVDFDVSLDSSTTADGKPVNQPITLGCTGLPVSSPANGSIRQ